MKHLISFLLILSALSASAADIITATVSVTNQTVNGDTIVVNGTTHTWTNSVSVPTVQIGTNATAAGSATNLLLHFGAYPVSGVAVSYTSATNVAFRGSPGVALTVTAAGTWASVAYVTNVTTSATVVRVPYDVEAEAVQTNVASGLVAAIGSVENTNAIPATSQAASALVGLANAQTVSGAKQLTNAANSFAGSYIGGNVTNVTFRGTNTIGGLEIRTTGTGFTVYDPNLADELMSLGSGSLVVKPTGTLEIQGGSLIPMSVLTDVSGNGVAAWATLNHLTNLTTYGGTVALGTNTVQGDLAFTRKAVTTLANGANAAVPTFTNTFVEVSGPTAAFSVAGLTGGRDGRVVILLNRTGYAMSILHESGLDSTAGNRVLTATGLDRTTMGSGAATLIYSAAASRWVLIGLDNNDAGSGPFASMSLDTEYTLAVDANTYNVITNYTYTTSSQFAISGPNGTMTNSIPGNYLVNFQISFNGGNADAYEGEIFTNGVACDQIGFERTMGAAATIGSASATGVIYLPAGTRTDLRIKNVTDADDPVLERVQISLSRQ